MKRKMTRVGLTAFVLVLFATPATPTDESVETKKIAEKIYKLTFNRFVNALAYVGSEGVLLVDTGFADNAQDLRSSLRQLGSDKIRTIINSHADFDHVDGNTVLGKGALILSHTKSRERILQLIESKHELYLEFPKRCVPSMTFDEPVTIHFDSEEVEAIPLPGGHTDGDIVVYFKRANVAYLGDIMLPGSFPVVKHDMGGDVESLVAAIDFLIDWFPDDGILIAGHGRDATLRDLEQYRGMLCETIGIVSEALKAGKSCESIKEEDLLRSWKAWSETVFEEIDSDLWIETICRDRFASRP
jgi:glyoxylase-like metal-dependent hydrolase (beta-lactamase superfamily II)